VGAKLVKLRWVFPELALQVQQPDEGCPRLLDQSTHGLKVILLTKKFQSKQWSLKCLPAGVVKVSSSIYSANRIPSHGMGLALGY